MCAVHVCLMCVVCAVHVCCMCVVCAQSYDICILVYTTSEIAVLIERFGCRHPNFAKCIKLCKI